MQYQKKEVRAEILESAVEEFYLNGYEKASMRTICQKAGTSIGNLYRYFPSREALFDSIVGDIYGAVIHLIKEQNFEKTNSYNIRDISDFVANMFFENFSANSRKFVILFDKSKGSKFETVKSAVLELIVTRMHEELFSGRNDELADFMCSVLSNGVLEGIYNIVRRGYSMEESRRMLEQLLIFYFDGIEQKALEMH